MKIFWGAVGALLVFALGATMTGADKMTTSSAHTYMVVKKQTRMVYFVGDSITVGVGLHAATLSRDRWPARARNILCGHSCTQTRVIGHAGQCLLIPARCFYPIPLVDTFRTQVLGATPKPTAVVVEIGVNDLANVSDLQMQASYRKLVSWGRARGVRVLIGTIPPTNARWPYHDVMAAQQKRMNDWIRATWPNDHVDFARKLEAADGTLWQAYDSGDGLHPNAFGVMRMADAVIGKGL